MMMGSMENTRTRPRQGVGPTETFVEMCKTLYGDYVDPTVIWTDVVKLSPDQADLNATGRRQQRKRREAQVAFGSNVFGATMGGLAIKDAVRNARTKVKGGRLVPTKAKVAAGLVAAGQVANAGGDVTSMKVTGEQAFKKTPRRRVEKRGPTDVRPQVAGLRRLWKGALVPVGGGAVGGVAANQLPQNQNGWKKAKKVTKADDTVDVTFAGEFSKFDDDKRQAFGWASVVKVNGTPVVDRQGDYIDMEDLENAAYQYVHKSRVGGDMHRRVGDQPHKVSDMIESFVLTDEKARALKIPDDVPRGWWVGYQIHDEDTWQEVRKKGRTGFSIHGKGIRKDHNIDELMGY